MSTIIASQKIYQAFDIPEINKFEPNKSPPTYGIKVNH